MALPFLSWQVTCNLSRLTPHFKNPFLGQRVAYHVQTNIRSKLKMKKSRNHSLIKCKSLLAERKKKRPLEVQKRVILFIFSLVETTIYSFYDPLNCVPCINWPFIQCLQIYSVALAQTVIKFVYKGALNKNKLSKTDSNCCLICSRGFLRDICVG